MTEILGRIRGIYFDGTTSAARDGVLELLADGGAVLLQDVRLQENSEEVHSGEVPGISFGRDQLRVASRLGNTPRYIYFPGGGKFESPDNAQVDCWQRCTAGSRRVGLVHYLENHGGVVLLAALVVLLVLGLAGKYLLPAASALIVERLPPAVSQQLGKHSLQLMDEHLFTASTLGDQRRQQLQSLFARDFAEQIRSLGVSLHFRAGDEVGANAFALPSGDLVLTDQLVRLAGDDRELVAVMAHEVGHVYHHHMLRQLVQNSLLIFVFTMITGDASTASSVVVTAPMLMLETAYSRNFEREADNYALVYLRNHDIAPVYFSNMMQRLRWQQQYRCGGSSQATAQASGDSAGKSWQVLAEVLHNYLSSHPVPAERIGAFGPPTISRPPKPECDNVKGNTN